MAERRVSLLEAWAGVIHELMERDWFLRRDDITMSRLFGSDRSSLLVLIYRYV
jgi:hypothetical protein